MLALLLLLQEFPKELLQRRCVECHGSAKQKGGLRLDVRSEALRGGDAGPALAVDGPVWTRVHSADPDLRMPPKGERLSEAELDLLRRWMKAGAPWPEDVGPAKVTSDHWAFKPIRRPPGNSIDDFVRAELAKRGLKPSPPADPATLARRVSLDLVGLPPEGDLPYEERVERLLASPRYGERWARRWLDLARYADTNGYEKDRPRSIWPWRDWVIRALNEDMPFDQFTVLQLAGDLLGDPLPTGFHRNTMVNEEGGIDVEEFRFEAVVDRVATTGTVWLGLTIGCAQCHSHKFDPISQREYYRLFAYFNNADEPEVPVPDAAIEKRRRDILHKIAELEAKLLAVDDPAYAAWRAAQTVRWTPVAPSAIAASKGGTFDVLDDRSVLVSGDNPNNNAYTLTLPRGGRALRLDVLPHESLPDGGPGRAPLFQTGDFLLSEVAVEGGKIVAGFHSYAQAGRSAAQAFDGKLDTGWSVKGRAGEAHHAVFVLEKAVDGPLRVTLTQEYIHQMTIGRFRLSLTDDVPAEAGPGDVDETYWKLHVRPSPERDEIAKLKKSLPKHPTTLVMKERRPQHARRTRIHHRGLFLSPKEEVEPGVPAVLPPTDAKDRLGFAKWLVDGKNPLTARVIVNRHWQAFFGRGLVGTLENFGTRGESPSHPELLDWLASEFMARGWSVKALHRLIVTSETYKQASTWAGEDPENRWYGRAARFRLDAELLRDQALAVSGLLDGRIGGPSVHPPQPEGVWETAYGSPKWPSSQGADRYRRGLYTYMKRAAPYAAFACFDAPNGEFCAPKRDRSNTPLQALNLLNDRVYVEAAEALGKSTPSADGLFRRVLNRAPSASEKEVVEAFAAKHGWARAARVVLNLDETVTRE